MTRAQHRKCCMFSSNATAGKLTSAGCQYAARHRSCCPARAASGFVPFPAPSLLLAALPPVQGPPLHSLTARLPHLSRLHKHIAIEGAVCMHQAPLAIKPLGTSPSQLCSPNSVTCFRHLARQQHRQYGSCMGGIWCQLCMTGAY